MNQVNNSNQDNNSNCGENVYNPRQNGQDCTAAYNYSQQNGQYYNTANYYVPQITARDWIEMQKYAAKKQINEQYEVRRLEGLEMYRRRKNAERLVVFRDWGGHFSYYIGTRESPGPIFDLLPNIFSVYTKIYKCRNRKEEVLELTICKGQEEVVNNIIIDDKIAAKLDNIFKAEGVGISIKKSLKSDAFQQLSTLLINGSKTIYLPAKAGWNEDSAGNFMFIVPGVQTFKEVFKNAV